MEACTISLHVSLVRLQYLDLYMYLSEQTEDLTIALICLSILIRLEHRIDISVLL